MANGKGIFLSEIRNSSIPAPVITQGNTAVPEKLSVGLQQHRAGRLQEAEEFYSELLEEQPDNELASEPDNQLVDQFIDQIRAGVGRTQ